MAVRSGALLPFMSLGPFADSVPGHISGTKKPTSRKAEAWGHITRISMAPLPYLIPSRLEYVLARVNTASV